MKKDAVELWVCGGGGCVRLRNGGDRKGETGEQGEEGLILSMRISHVPAA